MAKLVHNAGEVRKRIREVASEGEQVTKKSSKRKSDTSSNSSSKPDITTNSAVIYLGHIAHGFYEKEMRKFFGQFGKVKRLKLFRSQKSGKSKGYAFIEFEDAEVAGVAAESMHGYFLHERQLVCHVIPLSKIHAGMFMPQKKKGQAKKATDSLEDFEKMFDENIKSDDDGIKAESARKQVEQYLKMQMKKTEKLKSMGIDFDVLIAVASKET